MANLLQTTQEKLLSGASIDRETALCLSLSADPEELYVLADTVRRHFMGDHFHLCSIVNARSGNCSEDCRFCAQSAHHHAGVTSYEMVDVDEAMTQARDNDAYGIHRFSLVTSGRRLSNHSLEKMGALYARISEETSLGLCASMGLLDEEQLHRLADIGVTRYHCNLESGENFFPTVCTTHSYQDKIKTLRASRAQGLSLCSGGILGMGETMEDRLDMAFALRELEVPSIPLNILTPIAGTPFADLTPLSLQEVLTTVALFRLINPDAVIRMAGGRQQLGDAQYRCFTSGANGALVGNYLTTVGNSVARDLEEFVALGFTLDS